jgi:cell division protein FtsQ
MGRTVAHTRTGRRAAPPKRSASSRIPGRAVRIGLVAATAVLLLLVGYVAARGTSLFAVDAISIRGGSPRAQAEARRALEAEIGRSLLRLDESALSRQLAALPDIVDATFDRSFPHTLRVRLRSERPVLLVRQGSKASWLVSARGRVMRKVTMPRRSSLPRLWLPKTIDMRPGQTLPSADGRLAAAAVAPIVGRVFHGGVRTVTSSPGALTLVLRRGPQIRLGDLGDLRLKLAIAGRIIRYASARGVTDPAYVDVSVPERPVLGSRQA